MVLCWVHAPLAEFTARPYLELGFSEPTVLAHPGRISPDGRMMIAGMAERVKAIPSDKYALGRARRLLQHGATMMCLADEQLGSELQPLVFRLVKIVKARVVFPSAKRMPDGTIHVKYVNAPRPYCESEEAIEENMAALRESQRQALESLGLTTESFRQS
jgi:hypothetical protein